MGKRPRGLEQWPELLSPNCPVALCRGPSGGGQGCTGTGGAALDIRGNLEGNIENGTTGVKCRYGRKLMRKSVLCNVEVEPVERLDKHGKFQPLNGKGEPAVSAQQLGEILFIFSFVRAYYLVHLASFVH